MRGRGIAVVVCVMVCVCVMRSAAVDPDVPTATSMQAQATDTPATTTTSRIIAHGSITAPAHASAATVGDDMTVLPNGRSALSNDGERAVIFLPPRTITLPDFELRPPYEGDLSQLRELHRKLYQVANDSCAGDTISCLEGYLFDQQRDFLYRAAVHPTVKTICEIGFNAGHSASTFLFANRKAKVISFDLFDKVYSGPVLGFLSRVFGEDRLTVLTGNSTRTVRAFSSMHPELRCELLYVDGGHDGETPYIDIVNMERFATCGSFVIIDDVPIGSHVMSGWLRALDEGHLQSLGCEQHMVMQPEAGPHPLMRGWCTGVYTKTCRK